MMNNAFDMHDHQTSIKFLSSKFVSNELKLLISPIFSLLAVVFVEYSKFRKSFALISIIYVKANWHDLFFVLHRPPINKCSSQSTHFTPRHPANQKPGRCVGWHERAQPQEHILADGRDDA